MSDPVRRVGTTLVVAVSGQVRLALQVAVTPAGPASLEESLRVECDGRAVEVREELIPGNGRIHLCEPPEGRLEIAYSATVRGVAAEPAVEEAERITYLRPSRYAQSDRLAATAWAEFAGIATPRDLLAAVSSWVGSRLVYAPGRSGPTDGAVDTLLQRQGVCRDYAHLVVALLRAMDVPTRLAAVYAPGLAPMDFHAVAEAAVDGVWRVVDATLLAPRSSLVRISTGRDAADTAFLSSYGGNAELLESNVTATVDGTLPADDVTELVSLR